MYFIDSYSYSTQNPLFAGSQLGNNLISLAINGYPNVF
jgi:hypothetical protein